jgi:hypothetical protein
MWGALMILKAAVLRISRADMAQICLSAPQPTET